MAGTAAMAKPAHHVPPPTPTGHADGPCGFGAEGLPPTLACGGLDSVPDGSPLASALAMSRDDDNDERKRACQVRKPDMQGHLVFGCGVAQQEENELRVLSYVGRCFPGTLHMSQNPFSR